MTTSKSSSNVTYNYRFGHKGRIVGNPAGCWRSEQDCMSCYYSQVSDDNTWYGSQRCWDSQCLKWECAPDCPRCSRHRTFGIDQIHQAWKHDVDPVWVEVTYMLDGARYYEVLRRDQLKDLERWYWAQIDEANYSRSEEPEWWTISRFGYACAVLDAWIEHNNWLPIYRHYYDSRRERCISYLLRAQSILERYC